MLLQPYFWVHSQHQLVMSHCAPPHTKLNVSDWNQKTEQALCDMDLLLKTKSKQIIKYNRSANPEKKTVLYKYPKMTFKTK